MVEAKRVSALQTFWEGLSPTQKVWDAVEVGPAIWERELNLVRCSRSIPHVSGTEILGLMGSAIIAGAVNAVAGGGTLLTFPTLLFFQTPPIVANATSTLALVLGTGGSVFGYRQHLARIKPWLWRFGPVSLAGGLLGSFLLTRTSDKTFSRMVPFLILFATIIFLVQGAFRRFATSAPLPLLRPGGEGRGEEVPLSDPHTDRFTLAGAIVFQFFVAIYGGYFGAGIGILMLASLGFMGLTDIHEMNTLKTVLASIINLVAAVWFIAAGLIDWPKAGIMTIGALAGYFLGSHFSQRIAPARVRQIITAVGFTISAATFYKEFLR